MIDTVGSTIYSQPNNHGRERLLVIAGGEMQEYELSAYGKDRLYFGRDSAKCDIVIPHASVSRLHGKIKLTSEGLLVADLDSSNGLHLFRGEQFVAMQAGMYYRKTAGDLIVRIESTKPELQHKSVALIFTSAQSESAWQRLPIDAEQITIGRDRLNTITMEQPSFSRKHAMIQREGNRYLICDNSSMNGVFLNGKQINGQAYFREGDAIQIAGALFLVLGGVLLYQGNSHGISLHLHNITKVVGRSSKRKTILNQVYCDIASNEFVAIVGGSGAGKTTVMTAMSGFDRKISGQVSCNGIDLHRNFSTLKNMIGFVPQQDIIYENLKLRTMLRYTAKMKLPSDTSRHEREERIEKVLEMVGLRERGDTYIRKLSGGQKKRASIAVELLADPGLFFLDEPTSGLDPDTEQSLMKTLAKLSKTENKTIILVTHTTQSIHLCDKVIFMGQGGRICYCGPPAKLTEYFGKRELLEVYSELAVNTDTWNRQYLNQYLGRNQRSITQSESDLLMKRVHQNASKQVSAFRQLWVLIARYFELIWNDKQRLALLFLQPLIIALLLVVVANRDVFRIFNDTQSILFALACAGIWIGLFNTIQEVCKERAILKREYMGNLKLWTYVLSKYSVQAVLCVLQSTLLVVIFLLAMKHAPKKEVFLLAPQLEIGITIFLTVYASAAMGLIVSSMVKNSDRAMALAPFVLIVQLLFSGVLFTLKGAANKISYVTVSRWAMECLGNIANMNKLEMSNKLIPNEGNDMYKRSVRHLIETWGILGVIAVVGGIVSVIVLHNLKNDTR